jgi:NAD(P)-dependent dehydrogenase (short-subunit alcohol dehydrogenase family)
VTPRVLVAGATGPVGGAVARELGGRGASVAAHFRSQSDRAEALALEIGGWAIGGDLLSPGGAAAVVSAAEAALGGPLDAVVNCAWPPHASRPLGEPDDDGMLDASLEGVRAHIALCRAALPSLRRTHGAVVFLSGALERRRHPGLGYYSLGKAAATSATLTLALEEGPHGVRVNAIEPGRIDLGTGDETDPSLAALERIGALRRSLPALPTPQDVARVAAMLVGPDAAGLTGQVITIAGGEPV